ncbi:MAG TPA: glycerate kinase [Myxococcota bacterium]
MKVLIAPGSFKESLTASDVARCVAHEARAAGCAVDVAPLADGGEGTLAALREPLGLRMVASDVRGMLGEPVRARFGLRQGRAVIEIAEVVGLALLPPSARDAFRADTRGVGELMNEAVNAGAHDLLIALGGSGTVDGGAGMLAEYRGGARSLTALVDVDVPLAGARLFARQKLGLAQRDVPDSVVDAHVDAMVRRFDDAVAARPGAGAAGGLGAALASLGASLVPGARFVFGPSGRVPDADGTSALYVTALGCSGPRRNDYTFDHPAEQVTVAVSAGPTADTRRMDFDAQFAGPSGEQHVTGSFVFDTQ